MSGLLLPLILIGGVIVFIKRCDWLGMCDKAPAAVVTPATVPVAKTPAAAAAKTPVAVVTGDRYAITATDSKLGPRNSDDNDHGPDKGFGFSKDGGPVEADGFTGDEGEPRVGDNRNNKTMTIAQLPGPCETKPYKGKVQYRFKNLSASSDTCVHTKQYYLYKYGIGGVWPIPGTNGGEGIREGGAKGPGVKTIVPERKVKAKAKYVKIAI